MGCCISRWKLDQQYDREDVKTAATKKSTLLNRNVLKIFNNRIVKDRVLNLRI
jgi:hypothetical protein